MEVARQAATVSLAGLTAHEAFGLVRDGGRYVTAVPPYVDPSGRFEPGRDITLHVLTVHPGTARLRELLSLASAGGLRGRVVLVP